jgi:hypothetical protein
MLHLSDKGMMRSQFFYLKEITEKMLPAFCHNGRISLYQVLFCQVEFLELICISAGTFSALINGFQHIAGRDVDDKPP